MRDQRALRLPAKGGLGIGAPATVSGGESGTTVLECDWTRLGGSALGRTNAQITDNSFWSLTGGDESSGSEIVTATSASMPGSGNAIKLRVSNAGASPLLHKTGLGTISASGGTRNYRWSFLFEQTYEADIQEHPIQDGPNYGDSSWAFHSVLLLPGATTWRADVRPNTGSGENTFSMSQWGLTLTVGVVYQFEFQIHRTATDDFNLHGRVYDASGSVIKTDVDFTNASVGGSANLTSNPTLHFVTAIGADTLDELVIGSEGLTPTPEAGAPYGHEGGFKIVDGLTAGSGWIGPVT